MLNLNDQIEIKIEKMANEGKGLGRHDNQVIFVPFSAPGDLLKVSITRVTRSFLEAEIVQIIEPSPHRVQAPCPYYGDCGGCNFQHINYESQIDIKTFLVKETLEKFLKMTDLPFKKTIVSPKPFNYRNRVQLHLKDKQIGFFKRRSHQILPIEKCLIAEEALNENFEMAKKLPAKSDSSKLELFLDTKLDVKHRWVEDDGSASLFSQVNRFQNENLIQAVLTHIKNLGNIGAIFDLYAGSGNFSFPMAANHSSTTVHAVELSSDLIKEGKSLQTAKPEAKNIQFVQSPVELYLRNFQIPEHSFILLDPPRIGCQPEVMHLLGSSKRKNIAYISCNYTTLARDLALLKNTAQNWGLTLKIDSLQCFDMFPQTDHIEVMAALSIS